MTAPSPSQRSFSAAVRVVAKVAVTLILLALLLMRIDVRAVSGSIASIGFNIFAVSVLIIFVLSIVVAVRWFLILRRMRTPLGIVECWRLVMIGLFFNQTLPSGIGGDAVRVWLLARSGAPLRAAVIGVATDRLFALGAVVICMAAALPLFVQGSAVPPICALTAVSMAGFILIFAFDPMAARFIRLWPAIAGARAPRIFSKGIDLARNLSRVMLQVLRSPVDGTSVLALSIINQLSISVVVYLVAQSLGAKIGLGQTLALFPPAMLISMVPISFGGWGVREAAMVWLFGTVGVSAETSLATSIIFGLVTTAAGLPGGVFWLIDWLRPKTTMVEEVLSS